MKTLTCFVTLLIAFSFSGVVSSDIVIDGFTDDTNDRFTNSSQFIANSFDLSGVGRRSAWGTLVSPNVVITAAHSSGSGDYHFYPGNDPTDSPVIRTGVSSQRIGSSDLLLVALNANVTPDIKFYNFATEAISATPFDENAPNNVFDAGSFQDEVAYIFGISATSRSDGRIDQAVGRNRVTGYVENLPFQSNTDNDSILFNRDFDGDADYVQYETLVQGGDSGAPVFVERNGELLLIGINSFRATDSSFSGITYTGNLTNEINTFIALNAVPEPSSCAFIVAIGMGVCFRRRRSN